jgi:hypothetical protein
MIFSFCSGSFLLHKVALCNKAFRNVLKRKGEIEKDRCLSVGLDETAKAVLKHH